MKSNLRLLTTLIILLPAINFYAQGFIMSPRILDDRIDDKKSIKLIKGSITTKIKNGEYKGKDYRNKDDSVSNVKKYKPDFIVSSDISYNKTLKYYSIKIFFWTSDIGIKTFEYPNKTKIINTDVIAWVDNIVDNINYFNSPSLGDGKFKREIFVYLPDFSKKDQEETIDEFNVLLIQRKFFSILERNQTVQEKCSLDSVNRVRGLNFINSNSEKAKVYFFYNIEDKQTKRVTLSLYVDFVSNCVITKFNLGTQESIDLQELDTYIVDRWIDNYLIERLCKSN